MNFKLSKTAMIAIGNCQVATALFWGLLVFGLNTSAYGQSYSRTYTRAELAALAKSAPPVPPSSLASTLTEQIVGFAQALTAYQNASNAALVQIYNARPMPDAERAKLEVASLHGNFARQTGPDSVAIDRHFKEDATKVIGDDITRHSAFIQSLNAGFDLNLGHLFSHGETTPSAPTGPRYGLVVRDIIPDRRATAFASVNDSLDDELAYAGKANVVWTIGPVTEESRHVFGDSSLQTQPDAAFFSGIKAPQASFHGKLEPASMAGLFSSHGVPGFKYTMTQADGLYQLSYQTSTNFKLDKAEQTLRLPVYGDLVVGQRLDDKFHLLETSAEDLLANKYAPQIGLHYLDKEKSCASDLVFDRAAYRLTLKASTPSGWRPSSGLNGTQYALEYNKSL